MLVAATRCNECGGFVSRDIKFDEKGRPYWTCPICGVKMEDHRWYKYVGRNDAIAIIEHRGPRGMFVQDTGDKFVGIDNSTGDAWTEEFDELIDCLRWMAGEREEDK